MAISDPVANALTKIRNASRAGHASVDIRASKLLARMLDVLQREGFIRSYKPMGDTPAQRSYRVYLKYVRRTPAIKQLVRMSRPGSRLHRRARELPRVLNGLGTAILSTSQGVMTEQQAYREKVGGEVLCYVW